MLVVPRVRFDNIDSSSVEFLFLSKENELFLAEELAKMLNAYNQNERVSVLCKKIAKNTDAVIKQRLYSAAPKSLAYKWETKQADVLTLLSNHNKAFLLEIYKNIITNPSSWDENFYSHADWNYSESSWVEGWKPEDLFLSSKKNRENGYWKDFEAGVPVNFGSNDQVFDNRINMRYKSSAYSQKYNGIIPTWQGKRSRPYENTAEGFQNLGHEDRRVQGNRGYDMSSFY